MLVGVLVFGCVVTFLLSFGARRGPDLSYLLPSSAVAPPTEPEPERKGARPVPRQLQGGALSVLSAAALAVVVLAATSNFLFSAFSAGLGLFLPRLLKSLAESRRSRAFSEGVPVALAVMSASLRAGASLSQAIERAAADSPEPVKSELDRAARAIKLGATPEEALEAVSRRVKSSDFDLAATATAILSRTGGNLAEMYDRVSETVRERQAFRKAVMAHTAQARLSGVVVSVMPFLVTGLLYLMNPRYYDPLLESPVGRLAFYASFAMIGVGWFVVRSMLSVDIYD